MSDKARQLLLFTGLPLSIGALIYYIFLPDVYFVRMIDCLLPYSIHVSYPSQLMCLRVLRNYSFDFIWAFALSSCLFIYLDVKDRGSGVKAFWGIALFEIAMELSQLLSIFPGTFDICDIFVELIANIIVMSINGFMVTPYFSSTVYDGKKAIDDITIMSSDLENNGITSVDEIELVFKVIDEHSFSTIAQSEPITFSTK